jgi:hypothetical protein
MAAWFDQAVRQVDRQWHERLGLVAGESKHHALVARAASVDTKQISGDWAWADVDLARVGREADGGIGIANRATVAYQAFHDPRVEWSPLMVISPATVA